MRYDRKRAGSQQKPFTLKEYRDYFNSEGFHLDEYDIIHAYMVFGSVAQNIDAILFGQDAILSGEFDKLFKSQFENPELMKAIVIALGKKRSGLTRDEIIKHTHPSRLFRIFAESVPGNKHF